MSLQFYGKNLHPGVFRSIAAVMLAAIIFLGAKAVQVIASPPQPLVLSMASMVIKPGSVAGGVSASATVYISANAPAGGIDVDIASNKAFANAATNPVHINAGLKYASFTVTTTAVAADDTATLTATSTSASGTATATISATAPVLTQIKFGPATVTAPGSTNGTVYISGNAAANTTVNLSSDQSFATVPSTVTIAAGSKYVSFVVSTVSGSGGTANISAALATGSPVSAALTVNATPATTVTQLKINPASVNGGGTSPATVYISAKAPTGGTVVSLGSTDAFISVPSTVTIPAGLTYGSFTVSTSPVATDQSGTVNASIGASTIPGSLLVLAPVLTSVKLGPATIFGGFTTNGTVILNATAPADMTVALSSDSTNVLVPSTVKILAGSKYATFTVNSTTVTTTSTATITAILASASPTVVVTLKPTTLAGVKMVYGNVYGGNLMQGKVVLQGYAPDGGATVTLSSDSTMVTVPTSVTVPAGAIQVLFNASSNLVNVATAATITATFGTASATTVLTAQPGWSVSSSVSSGGGAGIGAGATNHLSWTYSGSAISDSPVIDSAGKIYVGKTSGAIVQIDPATGTESWSDGGGTAVCGPPLLGADGKVYIGRADGIFRGLTSGSGEIWSRNLNAGVTHGYVVSADGTIIVGGDHGILYDLDPATGRVVWAVDTGGPIYSQPIVGPDGTLYITNAFHRFMAFDPTTGNQVWSVDTGEFLKGTPAFAPNGNIYFVSESNHLLAIDPNSQTVSINNRFSSPSGLVSGSIALGANGNIFVQGVDTQFDFETSMDVTKHYVYGLDSGGNVSWQTEVDSDCSGAPAVSGDGTVYVGTNAGTFYAFNPSNGSILWSHTLVGGAVGRPAIATDGTVYIGTSLGHLYAFK